AESLPHVFELLSQVGGSERQRAEGLGLGLAIVKEYVELHGGSVQVRSEGIELGSEFTIRLPLVQRRMDIAACATSTATAAARACSSRTTLASPAAARSVSHRVSSRCAPPSPPRSKV